MYYVGAPGQIGGGGVICRVDGVGFHSWQRFWHKRSFVPVLPLEERGPVFLYMCFRMNKGIACQGCFAQHDSFQSIPSPHSLYRQPQSCQLCVSAY